MGTKLFPIAAFIASQEVRTSFVVIGAGDLTNYKTNYANPTYALSL